MRGRSLPIYLAVILGVLIVAGLFYSQSQKNNPGILQTAPLTPQSNSASPGPTGSPSTAPIVAASPNPSISPAPVGSPSPGSAAPDLSVGSDGLSKVTVVLNTTEGTIKFKLYAQDAPKTAARFAQLVQSGFYNGLMFHRVVPGFVVQGGDPTGTGSGGSGQSLPAEFNNRKHLEGTVAMARTQDPNSADSQFYITLGPQPQLDHQYTVFGQVIDGMDAVRKIKIGDKMTSALVQ